MEAKDRSSENAEHRPSAGDCKMKKIIELHYNYKPACSDGKEIFGEEWESVKITDENVLSIDEHLPQGEGDRYYCDVEYKDGKIFRTFNPCGIVYQQVAK